MPRHVDPDAVYIGDELHAILRGFVGIETLRRNLPYVHLHSRRVDTQVRFESVCVVIPVRLSGSESGVRIEAIAVDWAPAMISLLPHMRIGNPFSPDDRAAKLQIIWFCAGSSALLDCTPKNSFDLGEECPT